MAREREFDDYDDYATTQIDTTRRKVSRGIANLSTTPECIEAISRSLLNLNPSFNQGLCHGARCGQEVQLFREFTLRPWIGSDICPDLCDGTNIVCHDFTRVKASWVGQFDVIYSNSLDHAIHPVDTLRIWLQQLRPAGKLCLEWTKWHAVYREHGASTRADCLAADLDEYRQMVRQAGGSVQTELVCRDPAGRKPRPLERTVLICCKIR